MSNKEELKKELDTGLYVGERKVQAVNIAEGTDLVGVLYEDGSNEDFTNEQWELVKSTKESKADIIAIKYSGLFERVMKEIMNARLTLGDFEWFINRLSNTMNNNFTEVTAYKVDGVPHPSRISLQAIHEALLEKKAEEKKKEEQEA